MVDNLVTLDCHASKQSVDGVGLVLPKHGSGCRWSWLGAGTLLLGYGLL